ncbi:putative uncharacterized protein [Bacteroides sp. CAG:702]|nr:putative uncharacterized protein [Bacteroides sp. CAG:702]
MHLEQTRNTFFLSRTRIVDIRTCLNLTRINTEESQTAYIRVGSNLKCQSSSFFIFARLTVFFSSGRGVCTHNIRSIQRRRQECTYIIQQCLHALILKRRTAQHRHDFHLQSSGTQSTQDFFFRNRRRIIEVLFHQSFVELSYFFQHFIAPFIRFVNQVCRDILYLIIGTHGFIMPIDSFHLDQVNQSLEVFFGTDRNNYRTRISAQYIFHLTYHFEEVRARTVHFVDITDTGNIVLVSLTPYRFRLRLNATYGTISSNSTVQHTQRTFYLSSKVHVPRSIDQVDLILVARIIPVSGCSSRGNRDTTFLLLFHPVHRSSAIMNFTDFVS